jgi:AraC-like DNA-binding protein
MAATVTPLLDAAGLRLGRFRCPPSHPRWRAENWIGARAHVVFPERPVTITRASTGPLLGDRNWAVLYEPGQRYRRQLVDPAGDECTFVELSETTYAELLESGDQVRRAFAAGRVLVDDSTWLGYQDVLANTVRAPDVVPRRLREVLVDVLVPSSPAEADQRRLELDCPPAATDRRVHEACRILASRLDDRITLPALAEAVGLSTYHFARLFRATTGLTVHAYRQRLQLRAAFSTCATTPYRTLSEVAMAAGYASHSHMTSSFRQWLRISPSTVRVRYGHVASPAVGRGEPTLIG